MARGVELKYSPLRDVSRPSASAVLASSPVRKLTDDKDLESQFVRGRASLPDGTPSLHRVLLGSGMGLRHSGELADASYYLLVER